MKIEMFGASSEAVAATVMAAAVLVGAAIGIAPEALASSPGDTDTIAGAQYFAVTSDAMAPSIPRGALTIAQLADPADVRLGDIVTVRMASGLVTRRVVGSDSIAAGRLLTLQADTSTTAEDAGVMFTDRATVIRAYVPLAGYAAEIAGRYGRGLLLLGALALLTLTFAAQFHTRRTVIGAPEILPAPVASA